jgi:alkylated DNA nucleotide flippase Atl1
MLNEYAHLYVDMAETRLALPRAMQVVDSLERLDVMSWTQFVARLAGLGVVPRLFGVRVRILLLVRTNWWRLARLLRRERARRGSVRAW